MKKLTLALALAASTTAANATLFFEGEAHMLGATTADLTKPLCTPPLCDPTITLPPGTPLAVDVTFNNFNSLNLVNPGQLHAFLDNRFQMHADIGPILGITANGQLSALGHNLMDIIDSPTGDSFTFRMFGGLGQRVNLGEVGLFGEGSADLFSFTPGTYTASLANLSTGALRIIDSDTMTSEARIDSLTFRLTVTEVLEAPRGLPAPGTPALLGAALAALALTRRNNGQPR